MTRLKHGEMLPLEIERYDLENDRAIRKTWPFGYMFPELQRDDHNLLENSPETVKNLRELGKAMRDPGEETIPGVPIPAIHTFVGQFVDHDITLERGSDKIKLSAPKVLPLDEIAKNIVNSRSPDLELDSVYGPNVDGVLSPRDPRNPEKMLIREVEYFAGLPAGKDAFHDFPRNPKNFSAEIGDARNDENIIVGQIHIAFLRAHNALIDRGYRFGEARKLLRQHYQWIVLDDFLETIADPNIVKLIRHRGARFFNPPPRKFFMPLEFSVAAFRFGHSKVRASYDEFNEKRKAAGLDLLFRPSRRLTDDWIIEWPSFLDPENPLRFPRPLDTSLTARLLGLPRDTLPGKDPETNLATRNLLRGFILRMPTGQAVAKGMVAQGVVPMTCDEIASVAKAFPYQPAGPGQPAVRAQLEVLEEGCFLDRTPLWFYILAEAAFYSRGHRLGPVGSTIVAEVLIGVLRNSTDSILCDTNWIPTLGGTPGKFDLEDLLKLAGVF
jgi:hypothetical protein